MTKILLVEDDKSLREIYGVRLLAEGYDIVSAGDGEEALATAIKEKPDLIVSDVMMPKISGFDMLDILRSTPETKDIRVIMMTALSSDDQRDRGEKLGADRYLVKSQVGIEDVVRTVHEVLGDAPIAAPQFSSMQSQQQPQPQPTPAPQVQEPSQPEPEQLPQPTAPFSSPRPATLGERIIHPIESAASQSNNANEVSLADRISAELEQANAQAQQSPQAQPEPIQQAPQQQVQQQQPQVQQVPVQQQDYQMPQTQQFEQPQAQQPVAQPQETTPETQPIQLSQPEMQMPQQQTQPQMQMQQAPQPTQPQQSPTESPQPLQIDPNDVNHGRTFNVPPRQ